MNKKILILFGAATVLVIAVGCNVFSPLNSTSSDLDRLEEAQKCLAAGNTACAQTYYLALSDTNLKNEKLCKLSLQGAGLTLTTLINTVSQNSATMLGSLANSLVPWTATRNTAAEDGITWCHSFVVTSSAAQEKLAVLLESLSYLVDCATRIARTDQCGCADDVETSATCSVTGNQSGTVTSADIADGADGAITDRGMCGDDAVACADDISQIDSSALSSVGFADIAAALNQVPDDLKNSALASQVLRTAIQTTLGN